MFLSNIFNYIGSLYNKAKNSNLSQDGIVAAEIAGEAIMTIASGGSAYPVASLAGAVMAEGAPGIMGSLGLGNSGNSGSAPDYTPYFDAIESQLGNVESTLFQGLSDIQQSVNLIQAGVTNIEMAISGSELQSLLTAFSENVNTIESNLEQYSNAIAALGAGTNLAATAEAMYKLLSGNAGAVDIAMRNVFDAVCGGGEQQGILDYQANFCEAAVTTWAGNSKNLALLDPGRNGDTTTFGLTNAYDNSLLITAPFATVIPGVVTSSVAPTFQAILTAMGKGMMFLGAAWQNTNNDSMLQQHITNVGLVMQKMVEFWTNLTNPSFVDALIVTLLNSYKVTVGDLGNITDPGVSWTPAIQPFGDDWMWWGIPATQGQPLSDWYGISSGVARIPVPVTMSNFGSSVEAYFLGEGWEEGSPYVGGIVCGPTSVTVPTPGSTIPTSAPAVLQNLFATQASISPRLFVATPGSVQTLTCALAGALEPSDGSAGTLTAEANSTATFTAAAKLPPASLASIQAEINGSIVTTAWVVLLSQQPTVQITPSLAAQVEASDELTFTTSKPGTPFMGALYSPAGDGPFTNDSLYGTIVGLNYTAPANVTEPTTAIVLFDAGAGAGTGFAIVQLTPVQ